MSMPDGNEAVDLSSCDREPIHIPGRIQPHGVLVALAEPDLHILQISANIQDHIGQEPASLLGQPLERLVPAQYAAYVRNTIALENIDDNPLYIWTAELNGSAQRYDGLIHRHQGVLILELEPMLPGAGGPPDFYRMVRNVVGRLQQTKGFQNFCDMVAREVQGLTGFDRVMVYRFDEDGHGTVIAEAVTAGHESFLGLHYPASDIPKQARALYLRNWLRLIPDIHYTPADIVPTLTPGVGAPLDLSYAVLRSVSPIHVEYLSNMGVGASMSISLVRDGALWGLIACHHYAAKFIPFELRAACEFLAQAVSLQLGAKEDSDFHTYELQLKDIGAQLIQQMAQADNWRAGLMRGTTTLLNLFDAGGVALYFSGEPETLGDTPVEADIQTLLGWLTTNTDDVYATNNLAHDLPALAHCAAVASGVLAVPIMREFGEYLLWFRPEVLQTVNWAGAPEKAVTLSDDGVRLSPRKSFALWQQTLALQALPWQAAEIAAATRLRNALRGVILKRAADMAVLNEALQRSNVELDAFAYIASHDLKEPLRGMHNYAHFLLEDYQDKLDAEGKNKLDTLVRLTQRMDALLDSLLQYSRVGRVDLDLQAVNLNILLDEVVEALHLSLEGVDMRVPRPLPTVKGDSVRLAEVLQNLISNAAKYNDKSEKWIEVGYQSPDEQAGSARERQYVMYVRDNGIGIRDKYFEPIFRIFRRLHARDRFGGGTGAGLTIAKKIVERHGGAIWLESTPELGTTFFFSIPE